MTRKWIVALATAVGLAVAAGGTPGHAQQIEGKYTVLVTRYLTDSAEAFGEIYGIFKTCNPANADNFNQSRLMQMTGEFPRPIQMLAVAQWEKGRLKGLGIPCEDARARTEILVTRMRTDSEGLKAIGSRAKKGD
jgi:hypothetical protein